MEEASKTSNLSATQDATDETRPVVLIVEDEKDAALLLNRILSDSYRVYSAGDGRAGLEKAIEVRPDLILCDLMMQGLSGSELVRAARALPELDAVPIVVLTALHDARLRAELLRDGAQDYLTKPFEPEELLTRVAHHIAVGRARSALRAEIAPDVAPAASPHHRVPAQDLADLAAQVAAQKRTLESTLETLRRSRALYHSLARDFAHAAGVFFDRELRFTAVQGEGFASGVAEGEIVGKTAVEVFPTALSAILEPHFRAALNGIATTFELPDADNQGRLSLVRALPVQDEAGNVTGGLAVIQNVREHQLEEDEWQGFQARILSQVEDAVNAVDAHHRIIYWNHAAERLYGISAEEALGRTLTEIYDYEWVGIERPVVLEALECDGWWKGECWHRLHRDGREISVEVSLSLLREPSGKPSGFLAVIRDITARKRAESAQSILSEAGAALAASLDYDTTVETLGRLCVPALAELCVIDFVAPGAADGPLGNGREASPLVARRALAQHADPERAHLANKLLDYPQRFLAGSIPAQVRSNAQSRLLSQVTDEILRAAAYDDEHYALLHELNIRSAIVAPLIARGGLIGIVSLVNTAERPPFSEYDLHIVEELMRRAALALENAHLYSEAEKARHEAEAADRAKDEFLAVVSHELRTPLTPILGWVSMLRDEGKPGTPGALDDDTRAHALLTIQRSAEQQAQLIDDLLDVSRIISGNARLHLQPVRLRSIVEAALETARAQAGDKNVAIWTSFDPALGVVEGDGRRLQQVVANLLSNAIKFTPSGGRVEVQLADRDGCAELMVRDSGIGIEPEFLPQVFERFSQADSSTSRTFGGLGLGLAIARHIVQLHGGTISASSEGQGQGAAFFVTLPVQLPENFQPGEALSSLSWLPNAGASPQTAALFNDRVLAGKHVLVVDDEDATRDMLAEVLRQGGAIVEIADSAHAARVVLARWRPDAMVCDIGMPGEDGYTFIKFLRALHPDDGGTLPAIALTAYARAEDRQRALAAGFNRHISKPVAPPDLILAVAEIVAR